MSNYWVTCYEFIPLPLVSLPLSDLPGQPWWPEAAWMHGDLPYYQTPESTMVYSRTISRGRKQFKLLYCKYDNKITDIFLYQDSLRWEIPMLESNLDARNRIWVCFLMTYLSGPKLLDLPPICTLNRPIKNTCFRLDSWPTKFTKTQERFMNYFICSPSIVKIVQRRSRRSIMIHNV